MSKRLLLFSIALLVSRLFCLGIDFRHFGVKDGLPQSTVISLTQDSSGNLWIGTMAGVSKYNGITFTNFNTSSGLAEDRVTSSMLDAKGNVWFGHWGGGISMYNANTRKFSSVAYSGIQFQKPITSMLETKNGNLFIGTEGKGLFFIERSKPDSVQSLNLKAGIISKNIYCAIEDEQGKVWMGTDIGVIMYVPESGKGEKIFNNFIPSNPVHALFLDSKKNLWIGTRDSGLVMVRQSSAGVAPSAFHYPVLKGNLISSITEDLHGNIYVAGNKIGLLKISKPETDSDLQVRPFTIINEKSGLSNSAVYSVLKDREGNLWIGTFNGLDCSGRNDIQSFGIRDGFSSDQIISVAGNENELYLGTDKDLIRFLPGKESTSSFIEIVLPDAGRVNAILIDHADAIWVATAKGIWKKNPLVRGNWLASASSLPTEIVNCIAEDKWNNIWAGTSKGGVLKFNSEGKLLGNYGISEGFRSTTIQTIYCDQKGRIWFGTSGGFVTMYDGSSFFTYTESENLTNGFIQCIREDNANTVWCGTYDGGLFHFDENKKQFIPEKINSASAIHTLLFDDTCMWIGTSTGVLGYSLREHKLLPSSRVGFSGIEINQNAAIRDKSGNLWFGTYSGLWKYSPASFSENSQEPKTFISGMQVFFKEHELEPECNLSYDQNYITFRFEGISLTEPEKVKYRYMLEGLDKSWSPEVSENFISYPNLQPGQYTFKVLASNNQGVWNKQPAVFSFYIAPPFWKTWWFRILSVFSVVACAFLIFRIRVRQIEKREQDKTALNKRIANTELTALRAQMNPHFIFNTLNSIQHFVIRNDADQAQVYLNKFASLIRAILNNSRMSFIPLSDEIKSLQLYMELESLRFENKFNFEIHVSPDIDPESTEVPTMLIQPYVENAIVHGVSNLSGTGTIKVSVEKKDALIKCTVEDNGIGRKKAMELKSTIRPKHKSLGLSITKERLEILNMDNPDQHAHNVTITDLVDKDGNPLGTRVEIYFPAADAEQ